MGRRAEEAVSRVGPRASAGILLRLDTRQAHAVGLLRRRLDPRPRRGGRQAGNQARRADRVAVSQSRLGWHLGRAGDRLRQHVRLAAGDDRVRAAAARYAIRHSRPPARSEAAGAVSQRNVRVCLFAARGCGPARQRTPTRRRPPPEQLRARRGVGSRHDLYVNVGR